MMPACCERAIAWGLAFVFLRGGLPHLRNQYQFLAAILDYQILPPEAAVFAAQVVPVLEVALAVCLLSKLLPDGAYLCSAVLLTIFLAAQAHSLLAGLTHDCGCFGPAAREPVGAWTLLRTAALLFAAAAGGLLIAAERRRASAAHARRKEVSCATLL